MDVDPKNASDMLKWFLDNKVGTSPSSNKVRAKPADPSLFSGDGTMYITHWFQEIQTFFEYYKTPPEEQVTLAESFLKGKARILWNNQKRRVSSNEQVTYDFFKSQLEGSFAHINPEVQARIKLDSICQGNRSVQTYAHAFVNLCADIPSLKDSEACWRFYTGLNADIRDKLPVEEDELFLQEQLASLVKKATAVDQRKYVARRVNANDVAPPRHGRSRQPHGAHKGAQIPKAANVAMKKPGRPTTHNKSKLPKSEYNHSLTKAQKDQYRAEKRCFNCGGLGHQSKGCPSRIQGN